MVNKPIEIGKLSRYRRSQFISNHLQRKFTDDEGRDLSMPGSHKIRAIFINSTPLFLKNILTHFEVVSSLP